MIEEEKKPDRIVKNNSYIQRADMSPSRVYRQSSSSASGTRFADRVYGTRTVFTVAESLSAGLTEEESPSFSQRRASGRLFSIFQPCSK
jgi:hypothetical protein